MALGDEWLRSRPNAAWEYRPRLPLTQKWFVILGNRETLCLFPPWGSYVHAFSLYSPPLSTHPDGMIYQFTYFIILYFKLKIIWNNEMNGLSQAHSIVNQ